MRRERSDIKILDHPGPRLRRLSQRFWQAARRARRAVAIAEVPDALEIALLGAPPLPAVIAAGRLLHSGSPPSREEIDYILKYN